MAKRPAASAPQQANLTAEQMKTGITRLERRIEELEKFDPSTVSQRWAPEVSALEASIKDTLHRTFGADTLEFNLYSSATNLDVGYVGLYDEPTIHDVRSYLREGKERSLHLLKQAIKTLSEEIEHAPKPAVVQVAAMRKEVNKKKVFLVHGRDDGAKNEVARFLTHIGLRAIILHERPNRGRTIITKFQEESEDVGFAVVLMTPDDQGGANGEPMSPRARQNVVFELGFFYGKLGAGHVAALVRGEVEKPSDFDGVVYIPLDGAGGWKGLLARELKAAGLSFDPAAVFDA